jgi:predicted ester cyclase
MDIKKFAEKFIKAEDEAWQKGNLRPLQELEDPNVVYHFMHLGQDIVGFEAHKQQILGAKIGSDDLTQEWKYLTGEGNLFAVSYSSRMVSNGKVPGLPPAGKEMTSNSMFLFRLKNNRIVEAWSNGSVKGLDVEAYLKN